MSTYATFVTKTASSDDIVVGQEADEESLLNTEACGERMGKVGRDVEGIQQSSLFPRKLSWVAKYVLFITSLVIIIIILMIIFG